jgi:hypothetical protein
LLLRYLALRPAVLQSIQSDQPHMAAFAYFNLLEACVSSSNPSYTLQIGALLMLHIERTLVADMVFGRARMAPGMVLLAMRLVTSSVPAVRTIAIATLFELARAFYAIGLQSSAGASSPAGAIVPAIPTSITAPPEGGPLGRFRHLTSSALMSVAEGQSLGRDMAQAGAGVEDAFNRLVELASAVEDGDDFRDYGTRLRAAMKAHVRETQQQRGQSQDNAAARRAAAANAVALQQQREPAGGATTKVSWGVPVAALEAGAAGTGGAYRRSAGPLRAGYTSVLQPLPRTTQLMEEGTTVDASVASPPGAINVSFAQSSLTEELRALTADHIQLFTRIVTLDTRPEMRFKDAIPLALLDVVHTLIDQKALREVAKWLERLHLGHKKSSDWLEAGMANIMLAAWGYRVTQMYYVINGADASGAKIPRSYLDVIFWHDLVRLLPELETDPYMSEESLYRLVADATSLPDGERCFTLDGQAMLLKEAAECFGRAGAFELSIVAIRHVETIVAAKEDYKSTAAVAEAMVKWSNAISATPSQRRLPSKYFCLCAVLGAGAQAMLAATSSSQRPALVRPGRPLQYIFRVGGNNTTMDLARFRVFARDLIAATLQVPAERVVLADSPDAIAAAITANAAIGRAVTAAASAHMDSIAADATSDDGATPRPSAGAAALLGSRKRSDRHSSDGATSGSAAGVGVPSADLVTVACYEVQPYFEDGDPRLASTRAMNRHLYLDRFLYASRVTDSASDVNGHRGARGANLNATVGSNGAPMTRAQLQQLSSAAKTLDVRRQRMRIVVHTVERPFPSVSCAVAVASTNDTSLDPAGTATETVQQQRDALLNSGSRAPAPSAAAATTAASGAPAAAGAAPAGAAAPPPPPLLKGAAATDELAAVYAALTPMDVRPAGYYFKQVVNAFPDNDEVLAAVRDLAELAKSRVERVDASALTGNGAMERYAACLKGVVDVECALQDVTVPAEGQDSPLHGHHLGSTVRMS